MHTIRAAAAAGLIALALMGCSTIASLTGAQDISLRTVYTLRAGYDAAFLAPAANYRSLPLCLAGQHASLTKPCAERAVVAKLQAADKAAETALDNLQAYVTAHPGQLGATGLYDAAVAAIGTAEAILPLTKGQ